MTGWCQGRGCGRGCWQSDRRNRGGGRERGDRCVGGRGGDLY